MKQALDHFYHVVRSVVGSTSKLIALHEPEFDDEDFLCVLDTVKSGWVSYQGEMVKLFEQKLSSYLEMPYVIPVVNGTSALFIALKTIGINPGDEVLVPSLTFAATINAVCHAGATPHFIDSCEQTFGIDFDKLESYLEHQASFDNKGYLVNKATQNRIKAIIPVYVLGVPLNVDRLQQISHRYQLKIIEDAAEALGSTYNEKRISALTGVGILSFNGNKIITTGGGGAVVTQDADLAYRIRHLTTTAKRPHPYEFEHDDIGYNLRLPAINAALGYSQLGKIEDFLTKKRKLYSYYRKAFQSIEFGQIFNPDYYGQSNCWLTAFILDQDSQEKKDDILEFMNNQGIAVRPFWKPLHTLDIYKHCPRSDCTAALGLYRRVICLPSSVSLVNNA